MAKINKKSSLKTWSSISNNHLNNSVSVGNSKWAFAVEKTDFVLFKIYKLK